nr:PSO4 [Euglena gracilis]
MLCCITGTSPEEPVISKKSGHLFERRVVEKYIEQHGKCPVTDEALEKEDLMPVQSSRVPKPRPAQASSIPGILSMLQNEWDAVMIESYTMKQHLDTVRQELAHALYQHDAACRVIARVIKERDMYKAQVAQFTARAEQLRAEAAGEADQEMQAAEEEGKLPKAVLARMAEMSKSLTEKRKKRQISDTLVTPEDIDRFDQLVTFTPHSAADPGVLCLHVHPRTSDTILTGGKDGVAVLYHKESGQITAKLSGHSKALQRVLLHPTAPVAFTASDDHTVRLWRQAEADGPYQTEFILRDHAGPVRGLTLNATTDYVVTASLDSCWNFYDIESGQCLVSVNAMEQENPIKNGLTSAQFHPDGMILGTGTGDHSVCIWDVKSLNNVASFEGHEGSITCLTFSENGFYLATSSTDGTVKMWDLRKLTNFRTLTFEDSNPSNPTHVNRVAFDLSGNYLAVAADNVKCYSVKTWAELKVLYNHTAAVMDVGWGPDARWLTSASLDRHVKIYAAQ